MKALVQPIFISPLVKIFDFYCQEEPHSKSEIEPVRHHEITFTRTGDFRIQHGKVSGVVHNQVVLLTNPESELIFSHRANVRDTCTTFRIPAGLLSEISGCDPDFPRALLASSPAMDYLHAKIYDSATRPQSSGNRLKTEVLLLELVKKIYDRAPANRVSDEISDRLVDQHLETIERAKGYMLENFDQELALYDIARAAHVSAYHFTRIFRRFTSFSPYSYLVHIRLNHAAMLLRNTSSSVTQICFDSGFNQFPHFVSSFTRQFGVSPRGFRRTKKTSEIEKISEL